MTTTTRTEEVAQRLERTAVALCLVSSVTYSKVSLEDLRHLLKEAADLLSASDTRHRTRAETAEARVAELESLINHPETDDWLTGARIEAAHQIERWGAAHDAGKSAWDWFWLIGYLAQKAASAQVAGDAFKAKHHTISTAAALLNWHRHLAGTDQRMRPGIDPIERGVA